VQFNIYSIAVRNFKENFQIKAKKGSNGFCSVEFATKFAAKTVAKIAAKIKRLHT